MASTKSTCEKFFKRDPLHGKAKRVILKKTLQAWIPCQLYMGYNKIFYIDGFSGKGVYNQTEQCLHNPTEDYGSPVIALDCTLDCFRNVTENFKKQEKETRISLEMFLENPDDYRERVKYRLNLPINVELICIEEERKICAALKHHMASREKLYNGQYDANAFTVTKRYECNKFKDANLLDDIDERIGDNPAFIFLDPFGYSHTPMRKVKKMIGCNRCLLITLMERDMNRFKSKSSCARHLDEIYDHKGWRHVFKFGEEETESRYDFFANFYMEQLQINGAEHTISFPVRNHKNHLVYYLIFATSGPHSYDCFKKLKEALNRASVETEGLSFSGYKVRNQNVEWKNIQDETAMEKAIFHQFSGQKSVPLQAIDSFIWLETPFVFRTKPLKYLEETGQIKSVDAAADRRRGTFPCHKIYGIDFDKFRDNVDVAMITNRVDEDFLADIIFDYFRCEFGVKLNIILWWIKRNKFKLSKTKVNAVLKRLEQEGKIVNVSSGEVGKKRLKGTFPEGCQMDFTSGNHEVTTETDVVEDEEAQPSQVSYQEEMDTVVDQEAESLHQASGSSHGSDQEEEGVDMESDQEASGTSNIGLLATVWVVPEKDLDYIRPFPGVEVARHFSY